MEPAPNPSDQVLTVTALSQRLKWTLQERFRDVWVSGEISNLVCAQSGHVYLTLCDANAQLRAVLWKSAASRIEFDLADGMEVVCRGEIDLYPPRGTYQLVVRHIEPLGQGALQLAFRQMYARLEAEGLFSPARKRKLPRYPRRIALVTSPSGAAIQDFLKVLARRWHGTNVLIIPARVQGDGSAQEIAQGIVVASLLRPAPDLLVVTRGGGSAEDLWSFNDERVVRAIAASPIPVISGVGHEIDVTLSDLVADVRALTPSEAAELAVPLRAEFDDMLKSIARRMGSLLSVAIARATDRLAATATRRVLRQPEELLAVPARRLDELAFRLGHASGRVMEREKGRMAVLAERLGAISPVAVLARGYSVTEMDGSNGNAGKSIRDAMEVSPGDRIRTRLARGFLTSVVEQSAMDDPGDR